jgi:nucleoside-diphosphate-sugar epimerase
MAIKNILITGAYGLIGNLLYRHLAQFPLEFAVYGLDKNGAPSDRIFPEKVFRIPEERFFQVDLGDLEGLQRAFQGMETVVHLAADAGRPGTWESLLHNNLAGAYHALEAARLAGVKRVICASSSMVNFGYEAEEPYAAIFHNRSGELPPEIPILTKQDPVRPPSLYAASKVWLEALAHVYAYRHGLSCLCLRIGWVVAEDAPRPTRLGAEWCSQRDIVQLLQRCIAAPEDLRFDIFYGVSDNYYRFMDIQHAREVLGYVPLDRAEVPSENTEP